MSGDQLNADVEQYLTAAGLNVAPPTITSDALVTGSAPIEQLLRVLGLAANAGDPQDNAESLDQHAARDAITTEAAEGFAAQDENAATEMNSLTDQGASQLTQQVPQLASGIAGALAGAIGGAFQPLTQLPQQVAQGAQQAMQTGMGMVQQAAGTASKAGGADLEEAPMTDEFDSGLSDFDGASGGGLDGGMGGTAPTAMLGPPPVPSASTFPSAAPPASLLAPNSLPPASPPPPGVSGMPMVPPGAMRTDAGEKDIKPEAKRLSVPQIKNGAPVQGRITTLPLPPVGQQPDGKHVAKRIVVQKHNPAADSDS